MRSSASNIAAMIPPASPRSSTAGSSGGAPKASSRISRPSSPPSRSSGAIGIGHTRWATHGRPTENNAHPHASPRLAVVHNGIIENFSALREELAAKGDKFATETDSEVAAFVVEDELARGKSPSEAVKAALPRLRGAFALVYLFAGEDDLLIGARQGAPLAIGYGDGEMYLGSDALALAPFTDRVAYLEEGDWVVVTPRRRRHPRRATASGSSARSSAARRKPARRQGQLPPLHGQGDPRAARGRRPYARPLHRHGGDARCKPLRLAGRSRRSSRASRSSACGTAYYAGLVGKYWFERFARLPVEVDIASEFRYREAPLDDGGLAIFVSQSGETADTLASLRYAQDEASAARSCVVNVPTSTIARDSDVVLPTLAGPEIGVASTKAFTCQLAALAALAIAAGRARGVLRRGRRDSAGRVR